MNDTSTYDCCIIGGGLAGLALSIQLGNQGFAVALFEKETYPFHKVCGEYISMESWDFIESLGLPLSTLNLPKINQLLVTAPDGCSLGYTLPLGGFGISRYFLDDSLKKLALAANVKLFDKCKVEEVNFANDCFTLRTTGGSFSAAVCCGSFGKRSNLDIQWKRPFILHKNNKLSNYIGVKYHIKSNVAADTIALHNFKDGYCGISKIEDNKYCLCYLTTAANLKAHNNSITAMEKNLLYQNKNLRKILEESEQVFTAPVTISQISFSSKTQVHNHILMIGDAAGMITPLCGNGMSMALHGSKLAARHITDFLQHQVSRSQLEQLYTAEWKKTFASRLRTGRLIQRFFGKTWVTNIFIRCMKALPFLTRKIVAQTHGEPF